MFLLCSYRFRNRTGESSGVFASLGEFFPMGRVRLLANPPTLAMPVMPVYMREKCLGIEW